MWLEKLKEIQLDLNDVAEELSILETTPRSYVTYLKARHKLLPVAAKIKILQLDLAKHTQQARINKPKLKTK